MATIINYKLQMKLILKLFSITAISILITVCLLYSPRFNESRVKLIYLPFNNTVNIKTILYWMPMFGRKDYYLGTGSKIFEKCTYSNCFATHNKTYLPIDEYNAIMFHAVEYTEKAYGKPSKRNPDQRYIFFSLESPGYSNNYMEDFNNFYNWTMTYRLDSIIVYRYGIIHKQKTNYQPPSVEEIRKRPKIIAWMVSNCHTPSEREVLHERIKEFIPVDVYGSCGNFSCPKEKGDECYKMLEDNYKFYFSFENTICDDYVTEKLYSILSRNVVPIVYGGANYTKIAPPNSVINVIDFKSIKDMVDYIRYLDTHPEVYLRFFEWKKDYVLADSRQEALCDLCKKLNEPIQPRTYGDVIEWWQDTNFNKCRKIRIAEK